MAEFLLVHGSCHGAWCWHRVLPELAAFGHRARAIDLPGHGRERTALAEVTLNSYASAICGALTAPTIVVGHSMAGYAITAAAEADPSRISALVYLCAYVPVSGKTLGDMRRAGPRQPLVPALRVDKAAGSFHFDAAQVNELFYHDCDPAAQALAALCLTPEPIAPQETALHLTSRSQSLPRHYIRCTDDRAIPPDYQAQMAHGLPPSHHTTLPASHSPFFACPKALAERLHQIAIDPTSPAQKAAS